MAKKISKKINSNFNPNYVGNYPVYAYGGFYSPKQYGFGSWLGENAGMIGTVVGGIGGAFLGNPMLGAQIGGKLGGTVQQGVTQKNQMEEKQELLQQQALKDQAIDNLPAQHDYQPTFKYGGKMSEINKGAKEEMEHTSSKKTARRIAKEHVDEHPDYYTKLKKAGLADAYAIGGLMDLYANGGIKKANGGTIGDLDNTSYIPSGGTHEQSPLGGVPVGKDALLEEGEYIWEGPKGKYVFSNRF